MLLVSNELSGKLVSLQLELKERKKLSPGFVALSPNHSAKLGIYVICIHVIVVFVFGTNGLDPPVNVHLLAHDSDSTIVYVHAVLYV